MRQIGVFGQTESQIVMKKGNRLDELDQRLEGTVSKWSRRKLWTVRTVLLILVATLSTYGAIGLGNIHRATTSHDIQVALQLNAQSEMTQFQLRKVVTSNHLLVYWAGGEKDARYLLSSTNRAAIVLTILPPMDVARSTRATYPQITTFTQVGAFQAVLTGGGNMNVAGFINGDGNSVFFTKLDPNDVYVGLRGSDIELQIFDPSPGQSLALAREAGRLRPIS